MPASTGMRGVTLAQCFCMVLTGTGVELTTRVWSNAAVSRGHAGTCHGAAMPLWGEIVARGRQQWKSGAIKKTGLDSGTLRARSYRFGAAWGQGDTKNIARLSAVKLSTRPTVWRSQRHTTAQRGKHDAQYCKNGRKGCKGIK